MLLLDKFGISYIEGGWPGSNPKAKEFFQEAKKYTLKKAKLAAFGSTAHPKNKAENDKNLLELIDCGAPVVTIFGKSWDFHVTDALSISLEKNLEMIEESVRFLKSHGKEVVYDAEHFFDGYINNPNYAVKTLIAAAKGGADFLALCETNGGMIPSQVREIINEVRKVVNVPLGIHCHNDSGCGVANSLEAVIAGSKMVQGTINGLGERCGNADLCSIIPNLRLKLKYNCISDSKLKLLTQISREISEIANMAHDEKLPYVGNSAFAHKGGIHVSAVQKNSKSYEHIVPELVGNHRRVLLSELSGRSNILYKAEKWKLDIKKDDERLKTILKDLKKLENKGYQFESAEASFELLMLKAIGKFKPLFKVLGFRAINEKYEKGSMHCEATVRVEVDGKIEHTAANGNGPVNALDNALKKALLKFYPELSKTTLMDYKVRVLSGETGTASIVRVLIETSDGEKSWGTVGASENIVEASWNALVDSIDYYLLKYRK